MTFLVVFFFELFFFPRHLFDRGKNAEAFEIKMKTSKINAKTFFFFKRFSLLCFGYQKQDDKKKKIRGFKTFKNIFNIFGVF
jgi:hypothetical protein